MKKKPVQDARRLSTGAASRIYSRENVGRYSERARQRRSLGSPSVGEGVHHLAQHHHQQHRKHQLPSLFPNRAALPERTF